MSLSADELSKLQIVNPDTGDIEATKLESEYEARMKREGLMDEQGVWLPRAIKEATK